MLGIDTLLANILVFIDCRAGRRQTEQMVWLTLAYRQTGISHLGRNYQTYSQVLRQLKKTAFFKIYGVCSFDHAVAVSCRG